jgi:hypothetical protein
LTSEEIFREDDDTLISLLGKDNMIGGLSLSSLVRAAGVELLLIDFDQTPFAKVDRIVMFHQTVIGMIQEALQGGDAEGSGDVEPVELRGEEQVDETAVLSLEVDVAAQSPYHPLSAITETPIDMDVLESPKNASPIPESPTSPDGIQSGISSDTLLPLLIYVLIKVGFLF